MLVSDFIWVFFNEVISHKDNNPTKLSVLMYAYFQMLYNFGSLFDRYTIQSTDRVQPLPHYYELKEYLRYVNSAENIETYGRWRLFDLK